MLAAATRSLSNFSEFPTDRVCVGGECEVVGGVLAVIVGVAVCGQFICR